MIQWIGRLLLLIIILFGIIFLIRNFTSDTLNVQSVQAEVFANRIYFSPTGFLFFDQDLQREVPGVFDPKKITDAHFDQAMDYKDESFIAARMRLFDISKNEIASATHNKISFERWKPLIGIASGQGAITQFRKSWFVLYANGSQLKQGIMEVEVLLPGN